MAEALLSSAALEAAGLARPVRSGIISAGDIRKYCVAVDDRNPLYTSREAAAGRGYSDVIAPPLFPPAAARPVPYVSELLDDGQYEDLGPPGLQHLQSILAGQEWEFFRPAVAGENIVEDVTIASITEREGRNGKLVFVDEASLVTSNDGEKIMRSVNKIVFREPPLDTLKDQVDSIAEAIPVLRPVTIETEDGLIKRPSMISLFMFCAAIWGVHRIHYDAAYARTERLPSPIIPGWMMATYLCEAIERRFGRDNTMRRLDLRYQALGFPGDILTCRANGANGAKASEVSVTNQAGKVLVSGVADFS